MDQDIFVVLFKLTEKSIGLQLYFSSPKPISKGWNLLAQAGFEFAERRTLLTHGYYTIYTSHKKYETYILS